HANHAELLQLPGVGENLATRIEEHRRTHGDFRRVEELTDVYGIGPATMERLRPWVGVDAEAAEAAPPSTRSSTASVPSKKSGLLAEKQAGGMIDVNRASLGELQSLPGIGPKMAARIVDERERQPFHSVQELHRVRGIGPKTLDRIRPYVKVALDAGGTP